MTPFTTPAEAWFWTMASLQARREGSQSHAKQKIERPCEPDDVVKCLDQLYHTGKISLGHARILRAWGACQCPPNPLYPRERVDARLWDEAMELLLPLLEKKGIVQ